MEELVCYNDVYRPSDKNGAGSAETHSS